MSQQSSVSSPSPDNTTEVVSSCRSSRAESEVPHRSSRSYLHSLAGSEVPHRISVGSSLRSSPDATLRPGEETVVFNDIQEDGACAYETRCGTDRTHMSMKTDVVGRKTYSRKHWCVPRCNEVGNMEELLYHSVQRAGGAFKLVRKLWYPFDQQSILVKEAGEVGVPEIDGDTAEYEAIGELQAVNGTAVGDTRSVVRNNTEIIDSCVSTMTMCMMPDLVYGSAALALCVGDVNGRVSYCELEVDHKRRMHSPKPGFPKNKSNFNTRSRSQTDGDLASFATSSVSVPSFAYSDVTGFHRPPLRRHSHQAYVQEMDCLTSVTMLPMVKTLRFLGSHESPSTVSYLTANERAIKLFRVQREGFSPFHAFPLMEEVVGKNFASSHYFPCVSPSPFILPVRVFVGCHQNPVLDLSVCSDAHSFLSADDLQVFWWNLEGSDSTKGVSIADTRPSSGRMEEVEELITSAAFHPTHSSLFLVGRSSGFLGVGDLREPFSSSQCHYATSIRVTEDGNNFAYQQYSDILCSILSADFVNPQHVVTRDYLSLKLWDLRRPELPYAVAPVMSYLTPRLNFLYENDYIFDRFSIAVDHMSGTIVTGLYDGAVAVWQPLQLGNIDEADVLVHYQVDAQTLQCEVENGDRTTVEALTSSLERGWAEMDTGSLLKNVPVPIAKKVTAVCIADGGERFGVTYENGRCIFIFERRALQNFLEG